jgi:hypothetical protein
MGGETVTVNLQGLLIPADKTAVSTISGFTDTVQAVTYMDGGGHYFTHTATFSGNTNLVTSSYEVTSNVDWYGRYGIEQVNTTKLIASTMAPGVYGNTMNSYSFSTELRGVTYTSSYFNEQTGQMETSTYLYSFLHPVYYNTVGSVGTTTIVRAGNIV